MNNASMSIRLPEDKRKELNEVCEEIGSSAGSLVRTLLYKFLKEHREEKQQKAA